MSEPVLPSRNMLVISRAVFAVLMFLTIAVTALALNHYYPATIEKVIDGDTIIADLNVGLRVILDDQYIRFYGIDAWEPRGEERAGDTE